MLSFWTKKFSRNIHNSMSLISSSYSVCLSLSVYVCVCVRVCVCVCVRPFTVKASSVWISWTTREQIDDVVLKTLFSYFRSLHRCFRMKHLTFLTSYFILLNYQKRAKPRICWCASRFQNMGPLATMIKHRFQSALPCKPICLWRLYTLKGSQSNQERLRQLQTSALNSVIGKVLKKTCLF